MAETSFQRDKNSVYQVLYALKDSCMARLK